MSFSDIWLSLEREPGPLHGGYLKRRLLPESSAEIFLAVGKPANQRMLLVVVDLVDPPQFAGLPKSKGISVEMPETAGSQLRSLEVKLTDRRFEDVFDALIQDIVNSVPIHAVAPDAAMAVVTRLARWQRFLQTSLEGLSETDQRGLFAELWFLRSHLIGMIGLKGAIGAWKGPDAANQDFQIGSIAIEVKESATKQLQELRIASERQLDTTGISHLFLFHLSLDWRPGAGRTLPDLIDELRGILGEDNARNLFEDSLFKSGYLDSHRPLYAQVGYAVREENAFQVRDDFPRIVESDLRPGVGNVRYSIGVSDCKRFAVSIDDMRSSLAGQI